MPGSSHLTRRYLPPVPSAPTSSLAALDSFALRDRATKSATITSLGGGELNEDGTDVDGESSALRSNNWGLGIRNFEHGAESCLEIHHLGINREEPLSSFGPRSNHYTIAAGNNDSSSVSMPHPVRSQSFRHRARPTHLASGGHSPNIACAEEGGGKNYGQEEVLERERRRSTPTVSRRSSLQRTQVRTDLWPKPKHMSEAEERFLKLPDAEDYTRVRQFKIDSKGAVVSRGDSFRRKRPVQPCSSGGSDSSALGVSRDLQHTPSPGHPSPFPLSEGESGENTSNALPSMDVGATVTASESRSTSMSSSGPSVPRSPNLPKEAGEVGEACVNSSHPTYRILVVGQDGSGKSSLIGQFITSEYRNTFADEIEEPKAAENTVSINIGGHECDLSFHEVDPQTDASWLDRGVDAFLLLYSIDRKSSFRTVLKALEAIRARGLTEPIILTGNKIDLERKRAVAAGEAKTVALTYSLAHFEVSVALNHDIDDLLVGIVAELKESYERGDKENVENGPSPMVIFTEGNRKAGGGGGRGEMEEDFQAAIRRFSQRKKRQMGGGALELDAGRCINLKPAGLLERFRKWRRSSRY